MAVAQRADDPLLAEVSGLDRQALRDGLREAVEGHILIAGDDDRYRFRHALLREVVEDDLLPGERSALHLALARGLEARIDESAGAVLTAAVAHHYASAGDQPAALAASVRAAAAAERVYAHGEASALLDRALELWDRVPDPASRRRRRPRRPARRAPERRPGRSAIPDGSCRCSRRRSPSSARIPTRGAPPGSSSRRRAR